RGLNWIHAKAKYYLIAQSVIAALIRGVALLTDVTLILSLPYVILSVTGILVRITLLLLTQHAAGLQENTDSVPEAVLSAKRQISGAKSVPKGNKFNLTFLMSQTQFVMQLTELKDLSLDIKDGIASIVKVFTPFTVTLLISGVGFTFFQYFIALAS